MITNFANQFGSKAHTLLLTTLSCRMADRGFTYNNVSFKFVKECYSGFVSNRYLFFSLSEIIIFESGTCFCLLDTNGSTITTCTRIS